MLLLLILGCFGLLWVNLDLGRFSILGVVLACFGSFGVVFFRLDWFWVYFACFSRFSLLYGLVKTICTF